MLNFWLGKLQRLQLFGYGVCPVFVEVDGKLRKIAGVEYDCQRDCTTITLED